MITAAVEDGRRVVRIPGRGTMDVSEQAIAEVLRLRPELAPVPLGLQPSFGFGDRTGLATPGHVAAVQRAGTPAGIRPIFAQQSIREMTRTRRSPQQVMDDAIFGAVLANYAGPHGADADHLKTSVDVDRTAAAGFCFFTIDPSDDVDPRADDYAEADLTKRLHEIRGEVEWVKKYHGQSIKLPNGTTVELTQPVLARAAVKYGKAINRAVLLAAHIDAVMRRAGNDYEIELSVDETPQPTTLAEHYVIAHQCLSRGMKLVSLAPRFLGDFEKGVDFKGDVAALDKSLADHAALAAMLGPYKLSLHSGSDKLSVYALLAKHTKGRFHVKTAGTSYLEALRVVARHDARLFARIVDFARGRYETDRATYHVSATLADAPESSRAKNAADLEKHYLGHWSDVPKGKGFTGPGRQILHCTFGSVLTDVALGPAIRAVLDAHPGTYQAVLEEHFVHHLDALQKGM